MAKSLICDRVHVARRYVRSVDMVRDLSDPGALEGYVLTPSAKDALERVARGLRPGSTQRAFRVTGPYGSGKSSFGLLLARMVGGGDDAHAAAISARLDPAASLPRMQPFALTGRRASLADDLVGLVAASSDPIHAARAAELADDRASGRRDVRAVLDLLDAFARAQVAAHGTGVLLLVDEMGRYLEFAAANPGLEDPAIFQLLAERAGGRASGHLAVVAFLHHRFADYVSGLGDWVQGEWARSSERYEEIAFRDTTEQTLHLLGAAIEPDRAHAPAVLRRARALYQEAADRGVFAAAGVDGVADRLYPLHPAAVACLATSARRFGQNERSVFSFLQSSEPAGFQRFVAEQVYGAENWYCIDRLYDYLAVTSIRFRSADRERRWQLGQEAVAGWSEGEELELRTLKALAVIAVIEPIPGLKADADCLAWCLGEAPAAIQRSLDVLERHGHLFRRPSRGDYSLWSNSSVDLERWFEDARAAVPASEKLDLADVGLSGMRPLVAHRHYHRTGTLRTFAVTLREPPQDAGENDADGTLLVRAVQPLESLEDAVQRARADTAAAGPMRMICLLRVGPEHIRWTHELASWRWVLANCRELRVDELAKAEVDRRLSVVEQALRSLLAPFSNPADAGSDATWVHRGEVVAIAGRRELSRILSLACDETYHASPVLRNELINRSKLSSAIAAARTRLLNQMIEHEHERDLGMEGAPPERTIYLALFRESGLHAETGSARAFQAPPRQDPLRWRPVWDRIAELVTSGDGVRLDRLLKELEAPPFGLRQGPALLVAAAFLLHSRREVALMEKGTFQPQLTAAHFMRLSKNPGNFALRHVGSGEGAQEILEQIASRLSIFERERPQSAVKPIVQALFAWWNALPEHAYLTQALSPTAIAVRSALRKAREPVDLLLTALPKACGVHSDHGLDVDRYVEVLDGALLELGEATPALRRRATAALLDAFGTSSVAKLRAQIDLDYGAHVLGLTDYKLRSFVDRAMKTDVDERIWLDGVLSLVAGGRLAGWGDDVLDRFSHDVRELAQRLARWLALTRESHASKVPISGVHLTAPDGSGRSYYIRSGASARASGELIETVRRAIAGHADAERVLAELLVEMLGAEKERVE